MTKNTGSSSKKNSSKKNSSKKTSSKKTSSEKTSLKIRFKKPDSKGKTNLRICLKRPSSKKYKEDVSSTDEMPIDIIDDELEGLKEYHKLFSYELSLEEEEELSPEEVVDSSVVDGSNEFVDDSNQEVSSIDNEVSLLSNEILPPGEPDFLWNEFLYGPLL